jgi:hypothetical protein
MSREDGCCDVASTVEKVKEVNCAIRCGHWGGHGEEGRVQRDDMIRRQREGVRSVGAKVFPIELDGGAWSKGDRVTIPYHADVVYERQFTWPGSGATDAADELTVRSVERDDATGVGWADYVGAIGRDRNTTLSARQDRVRMVAQAGNG